jgi:flagellar basal-body rod modification protein FlgD
MASTSVPAPSPVNIQDFLRILVAQLNYQDPLKPMDSEAFVTQLAQFTALQQTQEINDKVTNILAGQGAMQSVGLLGKSVTVNSGGTQQTGTVSALTFSNGTPLLTVTSSSGTVLTDVSMADVVTVR